MGTLSLTPVLSLIQELSTQFMLKSPLKSFQESLQWPEASPYRLVIVSWSKLRIKQMCLKFTSFEHLSTPYNSTNSSSSQTVVTLWSTHSNSYLRALWLQASSHLIRLPEVFQFTRKTSTIKASIRCKWQRAHLQTTSSQHRKLRCRLNLTSSLTALRTS